jgi:tRNA (cmo5U34)-methyltransferase
MQTLEGLLRDSIFYMGAPYIAECSTVVDLGVADGAGLQPFVDASPDDINFVGVDIDADATRDALARFEGDSRVRICTRDLTRFYPNVSASLTLCNFTLQYLPLHARLRVLCSTFARTIPGGAMIIVERVKASNVLQETLDNAMLSLAADLPRLSTGGVAVPASWVEEKLMVAGFTSVENFFRLGNIAAWIAVKSHD